MSANGNAEPQSAHDHIDLVFTKAETRYFLTDDKNKKRRIQALWMASRNRAPGRKDDIEYEVFITTDVETLDKVETLSLFTLGVQSAGYPVTLHSIIPAHPDTLIYLHGDASKTPIRVGADLTPRLPMSIDMNGDSVAMISFKGGRCILKVSANHRGKCGKTVWDTGEGMSELVCTTTGHSNMPPGGTTEK